MRILYHYKQSAFSRRARLALAHKGLEVELRDGRSNPAFADEARKLFPLATMPLLIDGDCTVGDSTAITHYLDAAYPESALWPEDRNALARALSVTTLVDGVMNTVVDLGTRYYVLRNDAAWTDVTKERLGRAEKALADLEGLVVARKTSGATEGASTNKMYSATDSWCVADIWLASMVLWVSGLPARASSTPAVAQILSLGLRLPAGLVTWLDQHRDRADIQALG